MTKQEEKQIIEKALQSPQSYSVDGESITNRSAADIIALAKFYAKQKVTTKNAFKAIGVQKISTPGSHEK